MHARRVRLHSSPLGRPFHDHETRWIGHVQRTEKDPVDQAEHGHAGPYGQRQRQNRRCRGHRSLGKHAHRVAEILNRAVEPDHSAGFVEAFPGRDHVSETLQRFHPCRLWVHSVLGEPCRLQIDMRPDLLAEILIPPFAAPEHRLRHLGPQNPSNGSGQPLPLDGLRRKLRPAGCGQCVKARLAVVLRNSPFRVDPALLFKSLESRVQGTVVDEENVFGPLLNRTGNTLSVPRTEHKDSKNERVERALEQRDPFVVLLSG